MKQVFVDNIGTSYYITKDGKCYNSNTNKWLKGQKNPKTGYFSYMLTMPNGKKKRCAAHRLVALAYLPRENKNKNQINHIDGNKLNNNLDNLEWVSPQENQQHALEQELRSFKHVYCFNFDKQLVAEYRNIAEAARAAEISINLIQQEVNKEIKALSGGFFWSYEPTLGKTVEYKNTGKAKAVNQYNKKGKYIMTYPSTGIAARAIGGVHSHISECCRGKIKSYKGYVWRYVEDIVSPSSES